MGLVYNPSSFATNKTILQAIEELKKYLMQNPLACIYKLDGAIDPADIPSTIYFTNIENPNSQELKLGDILVSENGYYGFISSIGLSSATVDEWFPLGVEIVTASITATTISNKTPTYFTDWIYRFNWNTASKYLVQTFELSIEYKDIHSPNYPNSDFLQVSLPLSHINAIWYHNESDGSITVYFDANDHVDASYESSFTIPAGTPGTPGTPGVSITGATIDGSNHLILTLSDGNTIDAGALPTPSEYTHTVSITSTSGTFSDSDFALLGYGDSVIKYTDAYSVTTVYKIKLETASILEFECIDASSKNNLKLLDVNKTTKAYSMTSVSMIKSATFDSGTATSGKVLTANGSGGTSWESVSVPAPEGTSVKSTGETSGKVLTADGSGGASWETAGGGSGKYLHSFQIRDGFGTYIRLYCNIISTSSTALSTVADVVSLLGGALYTQYTSCNGMGVINNSVVTIVAIGSGVGGVSVAYTDHSTQNILTTTIVNATSIYSDDVIVL